MGGTVVYDPTCGFCEPDPIERLGKKAPPSNRRQCPSNVRRKERSHHLSAYGIGGSRVAGRENGSY